MAAYIDEAAPPKPIATKYDAKVTGPPAIAIPSAQPTALSSAPNIS